MFEKIEREFEEIEFLTNQNNLLFASKKAKILDEKLKNDKKVIEQLKEFGEMIVMKKRIKERLRILSDKI
jgi:hypothetical protein